MRFEYQHKRKVNLKFLLTPTFVLSRIFRILNSNKIKKKIRLYNETKIVSFLLNVMNDNLFIQNRF